jgi:hypothetical protein
MLKRMIKYNGYKQKRSGPNPCIIQACLEGESETTTNFFLIRMVGGGVQLGPLGTSASNWPTVPSPGDDGEFGGMMIGKENRSTRRKPAPVPLCAPQIPHDMTESEPGPLRWQASD